MRKLLALCLLLTAFIAVNAEGIHANEVEEDRDDIDDEDEEDRDDIDEEDEDEKEDRNELIDMNVEDRKKDPECGIRCGAKAIGPKIHTGTLRVNTPSRCQELCEKRADCQFFTWRDRDLKAKWRLRRRCYLLKEVKEVKKRHNWCWGPRECT